ncbi:MAG: Dihydrolipoyllysine-residue acetyltransferase component of acetoin cleaving system [candidate division WS6 bacterium OLB21]|uniref:Dihydrolipoyllysine-residue acetyltransferase component of acetoin cleaving system n=1 Tax=candidate division WS6 bacterium OLB21 TaxID=1617427 RepID=A0A136KFW8_9BACT|nr:MAG: Dihydrolipoyllysine-residue acetyltransferase component of acetoin cleaving system [candidate division WS6 bacterium OLB21]
MKINYQVKGEGVSLILLHGWGGSISSLAPLQDQLSDLGFQVFNLDLPGFGQSTMSKEEMTISDYVEFLANYINRLNIYKPVIVGHSFGGQVAMAFAIKNPLVASRLVLINASGLNPRNGMKKTSMLIVAKIFGAVLSIPPFSIIKGISRKLFYKFIVRESDYAKAGNMKSTMKNILAKKS